MAAKTRRAVKTSRATLAETAFVQSTTVTVAGTQYGAIDLIGFGTPHPMVSLQIGPVLCRAADPYATVPHVLEGWRAAAVQARRLPRLLPKQLVGRPSLEQQVTGVVLKFSALPGLSFRLVPPPTPGGRNVLEMRIGPVTWLVLDYAAWESMTKTWQQAYALVKPT